MACLETKEDAKGLVKRNTLDFLFSHFRLTRNLFSETEKSILVHVSFQYNNQRPF